MVEKRFQDLDELVQRVRNPTTTGLFKEAVNCYQVGALRSAIVAAWTACAVDLLLKLRDLEHGGDRAAMQLLERFEIARDAEDVAALLQLEREVLDRARTEFEFVTGEEHADLERLRADRHRCAHPTLRETDEPYQPSPELVRAHLRTAAESLLVQSAVQGKAALNRITSEVDSEFFPTEKSEALKVLQNGPLQRPRRALLRNFIVATYKALLGAESPMPTKRWGRLRAALQAVQTMHAGAFVEISRAELPKITSNIADSHIHFALGLVAWIPDVFTWSHEAARIKLMAYVRDLPSDTTGKGLMRALRNEHLREPALERIARLTTVELGQLISAVPQEAMQSEEIKARAMELFVSATSFNQANDVIVKVMKPLAPSLSRPQVLSVLDAAKTHSEYPEAIQTPSLLRTLRDTSSMDKDTFLAEFTSRGLDAKFPFVTAELGDQVTMDDDDIPF